MLPATQPWEWHAAARRWPAGGWERSLTQASAFDIKLQLGTNTGLRNLPLLGSFPSPATGRAPAEPAELLRAGCALPQHLTPQAAFDQRMKTWQRWQDAQATLQKKREAEARLLWANKPDKLQQAKDEIVEVRPRSSLTGLFAGPIAPDAGTPPQVRGLIECEGWWLLAGLEACPLPLPIHPDFQSVSAGRVLARSWKR